MNRPRQVSLAYLFLETLWIASALGFVMQAFRLPPSLEWMWLPLMIIGITCAGAAIGGAFGNMKAGVLGTFAIFGIIIVGALILGLGFPTLDQLLR